MDSRRLLPFLYTCLLFLLAGCFPGSNSRSQNSTDSSPRIDIEAGESTADNELTGPDSELRGRRARASLQTFSQWREITAPLGSSWSVFDELFIGESHETLILNPKSRVIHHWDASVAQIVRTKQLALADSCRMLSVRDRSAAYDFIFSCEEGERETLTLLSLDQNLNERPCPIFEALKSSLEKYAIAPELTSCVIVDENRALISLDHSEGAEILLYDQRVASLIPLLTGPQVKDLIQADLGAFHLSFYFQRAAEKIICFIQPLEAGDARYYTLRSGLEPHSLELIHYELGIMSEITRTAGDTVCWFRFSNATRQNENEVYCLDTGAELLSFPYTEKNEGTITEVDLSSSGEHLIRSYPERGEIHLYKLREPANRTAVDLPEELKIMIASLPRYRLKAYYDDIDKLLYLKFVYVDQAGEAHCAFFVKMVDNG